ncbi:DNA methyltransferase [bacterium (Candidatus Torokbacteria) CG_4_10_14_0_2_um_filter_35_8]|nr:MAG: DNA methyltransferase [bacterium (Candidatus Torokbacteria) CG_4_10_14_0_2_um_filter_35_8]
MTKLYNLKRQKQTRRRLRRDRTKAEAILWSRLRNRQLGYKFRRQYGIGKYVVDFCCPSVKLVVELDGGIHNSPEQAIKDRRRQKFLEDLGLRVKRYLNKDVASNLDDVLKDLFKVCKDLSVGEE